MMKKRNKLIAFILALVLVLTALPLAAFAASFEQGKTVTGKKHALYKSDGSLSSYQPDEIRLYFIDDKDAYCVECGVTVGSSYAEGGTLAEACKNGSLSTAAGGGGQVSTSSTEAEKWYAYVHYFASDLPQADVAMGIWMALDEAIPVEGDYSNYKELKGVWDDFKAWLKTSDADYYGSKTKLYTSSGSNKQTLCVFTPYALPKEGNVKIIKSSADTDISGNNTNYSLKGAVFYVYNSDGDKVGSITTDADGEGTLKGLKAGTGYYVVEKTAPKGFKLDSSKTTFKIVADETTTVKVSDVPITGGVKIVKASSDTSISNGNTNYTLKGAEFKIYNSLNELKGTLTTNANGVASISGLPLGSYTIKETKPPEGFKLSTKTYSCRITEDETTVTVNVSNDPYSGSVKLIKTSSNTKITNGNSNYSLEGAQYAVYNSLNVKVGTLITNASGVATLSDLPLGSYSIKEVKAPKGYKLDTTKFTIKITKTEASATVSAKDDPYTGDVKLKKVSANPAITDGNSCYSLEGAVYGIYSSNGTKLGTITTDKNGEGTLTDLPIGTGYYAKEEQPPKGYALDGTKITFAITANNTTNISAKDKPQNDPVGIFLKKLDSTTGKGVALGDGSLANAEFTVKYYDGFYSSEIELNGITPLKIWVFKTDEDGFSYLDPIYLKSGDDLYVDASGGAVIPLGTITVQETKAPIGYLVDDTLHIRQITSNNSGTETVESYNAPIIKEDVKTGNISIVKVLDEDNGTSGPLEAEQGAEFQLYLKSAGSYATAEAEEKDVLVTDKNGKATSKDLPYGTYILHQTKGKKGYIFAEDMEVTIYENGQELSYTITNIREKLYINIVKVDAETGETIALAGTTFKLKDENGDYIVQTVRTPQGNITYSEYQTGADGVAMIPQKIPTQKITVCEIKSPAGYLIGDDYTFELSVDDAENYTVTVTFKNTPIKGKILVEKLGDAFVGVNEISGVKAPVFEEKPLSGAVFDVIAAEDIIVGGHRKASKGDVVDTITTTAGNDWSKLLYLGKYQLVERSTVDGYLLDTTPHNVELTEKDSVTAVVTTSAAITNEWQQTSATLKKEAEFLEITGDGETIKTVIEVRAGEGFTFGLYAAQEFTAYGETEPCIIEGDLVAKAVSDKNGNVVFDAQLPHGKYYIKEIYTNTAYEQNDTRYDVDFSYNADVTEIIVDIEDAVLNDLKTQEVTITKKDLTTDEPLAGVIIEVTNTQTQEVIYRDAADADGELKDIIVVPGVIYEYREILTVEGYELNTEVFTFSVDEQGNITGSTVIYNDYSRFELLKTKEDGITPLAGCTFGLFNEAGEQILTAVSDENGMVVFERLPFGTFIIKEIDVPAGIQVSDITLTVTVDGTWVNADEPTLFSNKEIRIGTSALAEDGTKEVKASAEAVIIDTVSYENLNIGREYTVKGILIDKTTGEPIMIDDAPVTAETTFTAETANGMVNVTFIFNSAAVADKTLVVYETMYDGNAEVAAHADIEDEGQTVTVLNAGISTYAAGNDSTKNITAAKNAVIRDTVTYENLTVGRSYTLKGVLIDKATGEPLMQDGKAITSEVVFDTETINGTVEMVFTFDSIAAAGKQLVVFEKLYDGEIVIAAHEDIEDEGQTVTILEAKIATHAAGNGGAKDITAASKVTIIDTVTFENLTANTLYTIKGILMDKEAGEPLLVDGKTVTAEKAFVPTESNGEIEVRFTFDASELAEKELVVFETLYEGETVITSHEDISDEGQTVKITEVPKTGDTSNMLLWGVLAMISLCGIAGCMFFMRRKNKDKSDK